MLVSVIVPCYNVALYIERCLSSIYAQSAQEIEVILVDDGSTDHTVERIRHYLKTNDKKALLIEQENKGACAARNRGLLEAKGEYIQFLDADDWIKPGKIKAQIELAKRQNLPDLIVGSYISLNAKGEKVVQKNYTQNDSNHLWEMLMSTNLGNTCSNLFHSRLFDEGIRWNENLSSSQEYNLMFDILKRIPVVIFDSKVGTIIEIRDSGSISSTNLEKKWSNYIDLRKRIVEYLKMHQPYDLTDKLYQSLFDALRIVYPYNSEMANTIYQELIPRKFIPAVSNTSSKGYILIFRIFGFKITQSLKLIFSALFRKNN